MSGFQIDHQSKNQTLPTINFEAEICPRTVVPVRD